MFKNHCLFLTEDMRKKVGVDVHRSRIRKYIGTDECYWNLDNWISDNRGYSFCNFSLQENKNIKLGSIFLQIL